MNSSLALAMKIKMKIEKETVCLSLFPVSCALFLFLVEYHSILSLRIISFHFYFLSTKKKENEQIISTQQCKRSFHGKPGVCVCVCVCLNGSYCFFVVFLSSSSFFSVVMLCVLELNK